MNTLIHFLKLKEMCGQCITADCNGEGANDLAEINTRGGSSASTLQIHSLHHAATSPPLHAIIGAKIICSTFSQLISANNFDTETFLRSNLVDSNLK